MRPTLVFEYLHDKFDHTLNTRNNLLFVFSGLVIGIKSLFRAEVVNEVDIRFQILDLVLSVMVSLITGNYIISPIIFGIGILLKGRSELIDIRTVVAYSQIPVILTFPMILYLGINGRYAQLSGIELWIVNGVNILSWLISTNIALRGLALYNGYGIAKACLNMIPFWLLGVAWWMY